MAFALKLSLLFWCNVFRVHWAMWGQEYELTRALSCWEAQSLVVWKCSRDFIYLSFREVIVVKISSCLHSCILVRFVKQSLKTCEMFNLTSFSCYLHNQAVGSFHPMSEGTAGNTWTMCMTDPLKGVMQERVPSLTLPNTHFHSPSNQLFYSSHCIPLSVCTLFKNHHGLLLFLVLLNAFHQSCFFLLFYSVLSILYPAFFRWRFSRLTHTCTHTHIRSHWSFPEWNSVTPRWVFGSV